MLVLNAPYTSGSASTTIDESANATATAAATAAISNRCRCAVSRRTAGGEEPFVATRPL